MIRHEASHLPSSKMLPAVAIEPRSSPPPRIPANVPDLRSARSGPERYRARREAAPADGQGRARCRAGAARRRASGRICAALGRAAQMADGLHRLGRLAVVARKARRCSSTGVTSCRRRAKSTRASSRCCRSREAKLASWLGKSSEVGRRAWASIPGCNRQRDRGPGRGAEPKGIKLKPLGANPVDRDLGRERPAPPKRPGDPASMKYAGKPAERQDRRTAGHAAEGGQDAVVLTLPDSIAWLFNIRG